jgi:hypothetical protein
MPLELPRRRSVQTRRALLVCLIFLRLEDGAARQSVVVQVWNLNGVVAVPAHDEQFARIAAMSLHFILFIKIENINDTISQALKI